MKIVCRMTVKLLCTSINICKQAQQLHSLYVTMAIHAIKFDVDFLGAQPLKRPSSKMLGLTPIASIEVCAYGVKFTNLHVIMS